MKFVLPKEFYRWLAVVLVGNGYSHQPVGSIGDSATGWVTTISAGCRDGEAQSQGRENAVGSKSQVYSFRKEGQVYLSTQSSLIRKDYAYDLPKRSEAG